MHEKNRPPPDGAMPATGRGAVDRRKNESKKWGTRGDYFPQLPMEPVSAVFIFWQDNCLDGCCWMTMGSCRHC